MKAAILVLLCGVIATALAEVDLEAAKKSAQRVKAAHEKCQADPATAVEESAVRPPKGTPPSGPPPANQAAHTLCISKELGWQNADGTINKAAVESKAQAIFGDKPDLQSIVDECTTEKDTPEATAAHLFHCYRKHAPRPSGAPHHED